MRNETIKTKKQNKVYCECCGKELTGKNIQLLELSNTDGMYYANIPQLHESQGYFAFGKTCAKNMLAETKKQLLSV
jgi:hypothetical protein